jgi:hypothetical protein
VRRTMMRQQRGGRGRGRRGRERWAGRYDE